MLIIRLLFCGGAQRDVGLIRSDLHLRFLQLVIVPFPTIPRDAIRVIGVGVALGIVAAIQVGVGTGSIPPGAMENLSTVGTPNVIVYVLGAEVNSVIIIKRVTCM